MRNLFFALAFMLTATLAFANSNVRIDNYSYSTVEYVFVDQLTATNHTLCSDENQLSYLELLEEKKCTISGEFTVTDKDGRTFVFEGTVTFYGWTCYELLMAIMAAS